MSANMEEVQLEQGKSPSNKSTGMDDLIIELENLKEMCVETERCKSSKRFENMEADEKRKEEEKRLDSLMDKENELENSRKEKQTYFNKEIHILQVTKRELMENIIELEDKLKKNKNTVENMKARLQVENKLPEKNINFTKEEKVGGKPSKDQLQDIAYNCQIVISNPYVLQPGQALITFESEEVAKAITDKGKHVLDFNDINLDMKASGVKLDRTMKFEVNMDISNTKIRVSNLPVDLPDEYLRDKVELTFYKSDIGGGEVEAVEYNRNDNSACITYLENGVAQRVLKRRQHQLIAGNSVHEITVNPVIEEHLNKLQMFSGISTRTVLLIADISNVVESEENIQDIVQIHFQKPTNHGGEVDELAFSLEQRKVAFFEEDCIESESCPTLHPADMVALI